MKTTLIWVSLLLTMPLNVLCQDRTKGEKVSQQLMQLERDWNTATMKQDKA